jgi:phosphatidylinositol alpha-1,6-mannosyltransferase
MRICLIAAGLSERNRHLQPWRYLLDVARTLSQHGHELALLTDCQSAELNGAVLEGLSLQACAGVRWGNGDALQLARSLGAEVVLWHLGRTSFLASGSHNRSKKAGPLPTIGLFTSPLYRPRELLRCGVGALCRDLRLSGAHLLGLLVHGSVIARALDEGRMQALVVECAHTRARLIDAGAGPDRVHVIRPAVDPLWLGTQLSASERQNTRRELGYGDGDLVVGTFGPAAPLRGLPDLVTALAMARSERPELRLLAFCRQRPGERMTARRALTKHAARLGASGWAQFVDGWTPPAVLARCLAACDLVALPFRLVPSDVPLSVLEVMALGRPVVVTSAGCLPELVPRGTGLVVPPAQPRALAEAVLTLARGKRLRTSLGTAARRRAMDWQLDRGGEKWESLLSAAMGHALSTSPAPTERARAPTHAC